MDDRVAGAHGARGEHVLALCFDPEPQVLAEDMANYAAALKTAAKDVGKLKKYNGRRALVGELTAIAGNAEKAVQYTNDIDRTDPQALLDALLAKARA